MFISKGRGQVEIAIQMQGDVQEVAEELFSQYTPIVHFRVTYENGQSFDLCCKAVQTKDKLLREHFHGQDLFDLIHIMDGLPDLTKRVFAAEQREKEARARLVQAVEGSLN